MACVFDLINLVPRKYDFESPYRLHAFKVLDVVGGDELKIGDTGLTASGQPSYDSVGEERVRLEGILSDPSFEASRRISTTPGLSSTFIGKSVILRTHYERASMVSTITMVDTPAEAVLPTGGTLNQLLLEQGLAMMDATSFLSDDARTRYSSAEEDAISLTGAGKRCLKVT